MDKELKEHLIAIFSPLNTEAAKKAFPQAAALSTKLEGAMPAANAASDVRVDPSVAKYFATASVDMWLRAVHSFLISASVTQVSPVWASVCGYYSSHYTIRAFAHVLGYFQLNRRRRIVQLKTDKGRPICNFGRKQAGDREHQLYWRLVKAHPYFIGDPLFTNNTLASDGASDAGHRDYSNYSDHLYSYPAFRPLDEAALRVRIEKISEIEFDTPPIPNFRNYPDIDSVQVVAYHRVVKFRRFLDEALGGKNRFWAVHRNPGWTREMIDFQLTEPGGDRSMPHAT